MASVTLGSETIVTDTSSHLRYGEYKFIGHMRASEIYQRSIPGTSGIYELLSGDRFRRIEVQAHWYTVDAVSLNVYLDALESLYTYDTLVIPGSTGGGHVYNFCRLESARPLGVRETGTMGNNTIESCSRLLTFLQVRI